MGNTPASLLPDFRPGSGVMGVRVIGIIELIEQLSFAAIRHLQRQIACAFHALFFGDQNQFCTVGTHRRTAFLAHVVGHQQFHAIAFKRRNHCQRNAGVTTGGFDQHITRFNLAALFRLDNHRKRRTVFYRSRRVIAFQFQPDFTAVIRPHSLQLHQRRIANCLF